jgi:hypothetical protein
MDFIKKHYEKLVLSVVLLAVAVAAFLLVVEVGNVKQLLADQLQQRTTTKGAPLKPVDLSTNQAVVNRLSAKVQFSLDGDHNTFNPGTWDKSGDGFRRKPGRAGLAGLTITRVTPLNMVISFKGVAGTADEPRYQLSMTKEYEKQPGQRRLQTFSLTPGAKERGIQLIEVRGPKGDPTELVCELIDGRERFAISGDKEFKKAFGYSADLRSEGRDFPARRVDDSLVLAGVTYKIVAIGKDELVVSAPNQVRTTIAAVPAQ